MFHDDDFPPGEVSPYRIELDIKGDDESGFVVAPADDEDLIRAAPNLQKRN
jgi:hypothetical protein